MPETETNFSLGNFDIRVNLSDKIELKGMGMLRYTNFVARYFKSIIMFIPSLIGMYDET